MRFYAASYYPRYSDPLGTFVALKPGLAEAAAERAADWENKETPSYCDTQCGDCSLCNVDVCAGMEFSYNASDLFTAAELKEHRRALRAGKVVCLSR